MRETAGEWNALCLRVIRVSSLFRLLDPQEMERSSDPDLFGKCQTPAAEAPRKQFLEQRLRDKKCPPEKVLRV